MNKKTILSTALISLSVLFTGCASMSAPSNTHISQDIKKQLVSDQPIISYFSKTPNEESCGCASTIDPTYSLTPVEDGYYRKLLGRDQEGRFLVQDFYQKTQKQQSSPIWIADPMGLFSFESSYVSGPVTLYHRNGNISYQATLQDGEEVGIAQSYYKNGKLGIESDVSNADITKHRMWYSDGQKAADLNTVIKEGDYVTNGEFWDKKGQLVQDEEEQSEIISSIYSELTDDLY